MHIYFSKASSCLGTARPDTELGHRAQPQSSGRSQDKDKRRTRTGHRAGPQSPARQGQEEDKARAHSQATKPSHRVQGAASECGQLYFSKIEPQQLLLLEVLIRNGGTKRNTRRIKKRSNIQTFIWRVSCC